MFSLKDIKIFIKYSDQNMFSLILAIAKKGQRTSGKGKNCFIYRNALSDCRTIRLFRRTNYDNLYTLDLICHGVPSPLFLKQYFSYMCKKLGGNIIEYNFRSKDKRGWERSIL